jgi:hypothetical protein
MSPLSTRTCAACFNQNAVPAKPQLPLHEICPCYRPKQPALG